MLDGVGNLQPFLEGGTLTKNPNTSIESDPVQTGECMHALEVNASTALLLDVIKQGTSTMNCAAQYDY